MAGLMFIGCDYKKSGSTSEGSGDPRDAAVPYENGYAAYESIILVDGSVGENVAAEGTVYKADGSVCPRATVTADFNDKVDGRWASERRCLHSKSDELGHFELRGEPTNGFALYWATAEGQLGASYDPQRIDLRDGELVVHVRSAAGEPIAGARVTPHLSGIDDMSFIIPPNIREILTRTSDRHGRVRYPSRLGDFDLGFEVKAPGHKVLTRSFFNGFSECKHKLFVLTEDRAAVAHCKALLIDELSLSERSANQLETGSPGHYHGH